MLDCWDRLYTSYVSRVELSVQRRLPPIFVRNVGSPDIHECFRWLMGNQRTPGFWGVTGSICYILFKVLCDQERKEEGKRES